MTAVRNVLQHRRPRTTSRMFIAVDHVTNVTQKCGTPHVVLVSQITALSRRLPTNGVMTISGIAA